MQSAESPEEIFSKTHVYNSSSWKLAKAMMRPPGTRISLEVVVGYLTHDNFDDIPVDDDLILTEYCREDQCVVGSTVKSMGNNSEHTIASVQGITKLNGVFVLSFTLENFRHFWFY